MTRWVRRHPLAALAVPSVVMLIVGVVAGLFVKSPAQVAAEAAPPEPSVITAVVERGTLQQTESADAVLQPSHLETVRPASPSEGDLPVVSAVRAAVGGPVEAGDPLVEVAGRPTFVLPGESVGYRNLGPGMSGEDVAQLQDALWAVGFSIDESESTFGATTKQAVADFYESRGYQAIEVGQEAVDAAVEARTAAERAKAAAETSLSRARRDYDAAVQAAKAAEALQQKQEETEQLEPLQWPNRDAIEDAEVALSQAVEDLDSANQALASARREAGVQVPLGEIVFVRHLPATVDSTSLTLGREVGEGSVALASGDTVAAAVFERAQAEGIEVDAPATLIAPDGTRTDGKVVRVTALPAEEGELEGRTQVLVKPDEPMDSAAGATIRVDVSVFRGGEEGLLVPEAAVVTGADEKARVLVSQPGEEPREVEVRIGASGDGQVAVAAAGGGSLREGDRVVLGVDR